MRLNKFSYFGLYAIVILLTGILLVYINRAIAIEPWEKLIVKKYGELKPYDTYPKEKFPSKYETLLLESYGLLKENKMFYATVSDIGVVGKSSSSVTILDFSEDEYARNYLLTKLYNRREILKYNVINNHPILQIGSYYWISKNMYIKIYYYNVGDSTQKQIVDDYLSIYPPTVNIQDSDFNAQKIIKTQTKRSHEIIRDADKMRILPARLTLGLPRAEAYIGMVAQCMAELSIRCWTGMYVGNHVDCPITFIGNDIKRNKKWKEFKEESISKPIVEENVNWASVELAGAPKCRFRHEDTKEGTHPSDLRSIVRNELNMSHSELKSLSLTGEKVPSAFIHR